MADAEHPRERRLDRLSIDGRADFADTRFGLPAVGLRAIELGARDDPLVQQPLHALKLISRQLALRLGGRQLRLLLPRVEHREHVAFADRLPRLERDAIDDARKIGAHRDALHGGDGADGASASTATSPGSRRSW